MRLISRHRPTEPPTRKPRPIDNGLLNSGRGGQAGRASNAKPAKPVLGPEASAELRDRLLAELNALGSGDHMAIWAHRCLPEKNRLTAVDAERVEEAIRAPGAADGPRAREAPSEGLPGQDARAAERRSARQRSCAVNQSVLTLPEPRRVRDRDHVRAVSKRPCLICSRRPVDAHHLRFAQSRALGRKVSDCSPMPRASSRSPSFRR
jgi:hypothetical protein